MDGCAEDVSAQAICLGSIWRGKGSRDDPQICKAIRGDNWIIILPVAAKPRFLRFVGESHAWTPNANSEPEQG